MNCLFCEIPSNRIIAENKLTYAIRDGFPVTHLHTLIIPKRHALTYFELTDEEVLSCNQLIHLIKESIVTEDKAVTGFNIGSNSGESAGQTIFHCHIHLIPRRNGDVSEPKGGIRHVIPNKGYYVDKGER